MPFKIPTTASGFFLLLHPNARLPKFPISRRSNAPSNKIQRGIINYCLAASKRRTAAAAATAAAQKHREKQAARASSGLIVVNMFIVGGAPAPRQPEPRLILSAILIIICQLVQKIACLPEAAEDDER